MSYNRNTSCVPPECHKGYQMIDGKCSIVVHILCLKGYVVRIDHNGKQYCEKLNPGKDHPEAGSDRHHRRPDGSYNGGSFCPGDATNHCWDNGKDFAKYLAKDMIKHCGEVKDPYMSKLEEVPYVIKAYPSIFRNVNHCDHDHEVKIKNNNKIDITTKNINKYTTNTNVIKGPPAVNGSYQGTNNYTFREFTDMPATSTVVFTTATTKTKNLSQPSAIDITGELKNMGLKQAKFISIVATIYDKFNQTLALENASPQPNSLLPGQSAPFNFSIGVADGLQNRTQDVAFVKYHWTWFDENGNQH